MSRSSDNAVGGTPFFGRSLKRDQRDQYINVSKVPTKQLELSFGRALVLYPIVDGTDPRSSEVPKSLRGVLSTRIVPREV
jgi:hypothetical protein